MGNCYKKWLKRAGKKISRFADKYLPFFMLLFILNLCFPHISVAKAIEPLPQLPFTAGRLEFFTSEQNIEMVNGFGENSNLPEIWLKEPQFILEVAATAYNSHPSQTDATPCITASGFTVCQHNQEDIVATNYLYLPFGSKVRFPDLFGDKVFNVQDRMNARYNKTFDIWMKDYHQAKQFGRKWTKVEILPFVR
jgi:3D (Asp-Asp-Asp) domain-containing protein